MENAAEIFDAASAQYAEQLNQGLALSGESADYFVEGRIAFLAEYLDLDPKYATCEPQVLDFGCGVGNACAALRGRLHASCVTGLDCSAESIRVARGRHPGPQFHWTVDGASIRPASLDVAYTSGVFHHISPDQRQAELNRLYSWLKPGGVLALFENNPWNPGTKWIMSRIPFDRDAQCLSPLESCKRLRQAGFRIHLLRSLFFFPRLLHWLRPLEKHLSVVPLGAQYVVVAQRPN
jgi:SAM-dependent methyltransferase